MHHVQSWYTCTRCDTLSGAPALICIYIRVMEIVSFSSPFFSPTRWIILRSSTYALPSGNGKVRRSRERDGEYLVKDSHEHQERGKERERERDKGKEKQNRASAGAWACKLYRAIYRITLSFSVLMWRATSHHETRERSWTDAGFVNTNRCAITQARLYVFTPCLVYRLLDRRELQRCIAFLTNVMWIVWSYS